MDKVGKKIYCDVCEQEIRRGTNGAGCYFGMVSWDPKQGQGASDFRVHHKLDCDLNGRAHRSWMELDEAVGPYGFFRFIGFMVEPEADRISLARIVERLFFTDGILDAPRLPEKVFQRQAEFDRLLRGLDDKI